METYKISPSNLASMAAPNFCPRCFWRLLHHRFKRPFNMPMPGIMFFLDKHQKQLAQVSMNEQSKLPKFFGRFQSATGILPIEWVEFLDSDTGILVRGKPDLVLTMKNNKTVVIDNKTAIHHGDEDVFFPRYQVQTNAYGAALMYGDPPRDIDALALLHYEFSPLTDEDVLDEVGDEEVWVKFCPKLVEVEFDPKKYVFPYLAKLRKFVGMSKIPDGREGCKDCELLDQLMSFIAKDRIPDGPVHFFDERQRDRYLAALRYRQLVGADTFVVDKNNKLLPLIPQEPLGVFALWDYSDSE